MISTCWQSIVLIAALAGAKYPNLVSAQWALESGWGQQTSGVHNYFGQKGKGTVRMTKEWANGQYLNVKDEFKDYESVEASVQDLVDKWHKNYKGHRGVNNAKSKEDAALMLSRQGYATSPIYANKLVVLMNRYSVPVPSLQPGNDKISESYRCR